MMVHIIKFIHLLKNYMEVNNIDKEEDLPDIFVSNADYIE